MIVYGEHQYRIQCVRLAKMDLIKEDEENRTDRYIYFFLLFVCSFYGIFLIDQMFLGID